MIAAVRMLLVAALVCTSCGTKGDTSSDDGGSADGADCADEETMRQQVLMPHCISCHSGERPQAGLDLSAPDLGAALATHTSVHAACDGETLVVPGAPEQSLLMDKLIGVSDGCGDPMPPGGDLAPAEIRCVATWIAALPETP